MVKYPLRAIPALGFLKRPYNDIEIYVEDVTAHNMHLHIFRTLLGTGVKLRSVNQIGDRGRVIDACKNDQANDGRKRLYVIDGDFDVMLGRSTPRLKYLYRLNAYDVENLIISESAILQLGLVSCPNEAETDIAHRLDFDRWLTDVLDVLLPLFVVYSVAHSLLPSIQTVGCSVHTLCANTPKGIMPLRPKVRARIRWLLKQIYRHSGRSQYILIRRKVSLIVNRKRKKAKLISGKRYLLPLLLIRVQRVFGFRGTPDQLKTFLASHYDETVEPQLARTVRLIAK